MIHITMLSIHTVDFSYENVDMTRNCFSTTIRQYQCQLDQGITEHNTTKEQWNRKCAEGNITINQQFKLLRVNSGILNMK